jgi:hypothetical protein
MQIASKPIYFLPEDPDLPAKRLINALNVAHDGGSEKFDILRRGLMTKDLSRIQFDQSLREQDIYEAELDNINILKKGLRIQREESKQYTN